MNEYAHTQLIESALVTHRAFGDSEYIRAQQQAAYRRRLETLSETSAAASRFRMAFAGADPDSRARVIGDTVVRCSIDDATARVLGGRERGLRADACDELFDAATRHLLGARQSTPMQSGAAWPRRLHPDGGDTQIWMGEASDNVFACAFGRIVNQDWGGDLCAPTADEVKGLTTGARLLAELLPHLSVSALSHAHVTAIFPPVGVWKGKASGSQYRIGGTIFLAREKLGNPWWVAEHLLHEAVHQKLYDFRHGHSLFDLDFSRSGAPKVCALWNTPGRDKSNLWDVFRAVAAFHVYVHLALLSTVAEARMGELEGLYGAKREMIDSRKAVERAHYLSEQIREKCWEEMGLAGKGLIEWLDAVLAAVADTLPPHGAKMHLLLDRYRREAAKVQSRVALTLHDTGARCPAGKEAAHSELFAQLTTLAEHEIDVAGRVLSAADEEALHRRLQTEMGQYAKRDLAVDFLRVRKTIAQTILEASRDGYRLGNGPRAPEASDELILHMIEGSSHRLDCILRS